MKSRVNYNGFALLEGLLILVIVSLIGLIGYKVYSTKNYVNHQSLNSGSTNQSAESVPSIPTVSSTKDLDAVQKTLDQTNPDNSSDLQQLSGQTSNL